VVALGTAIRLALRRPWRFMTSMAKESANSAGLRRLVGPRKADVGGERGRRRASQQAGGEGDDGDDRGQDRPGPGNVPPPDPGCEAHREQ
jgi:hypothetical protein